MAPGEHVYEVSDLGILVHNEYPRFGKPSKKLKTKIHHIVSWYANKARGWADNWTKKSQQILKNAGLHPKNSGWNQIHLPHHKGPHPEKYHKIIYQRLAKAVEGLTPRTKAYKEKVKETLEKLADEMLADPKKFGL